MKRKTGFIMREIGGENLLVPIASQVVDMNGLVTLNDTASCVWELLKEDRSPEELAAVVAERFEVDFERARADVQTFLDEIAGIGLLEQ